MRLSQPIIDILNDISSAAGLSEKTSVFGTDAVARPVNNSDARRMRMVVNDAVNFLLSDHAWDGLWALAQFSVPSGTLAIPLPPDFDRMRNETFFRKNEGWWKPRGPVSGGEWRAFKNLPITNPAVPRWRFSIDGIILDPIPSADQVFEFEYISNCPVVSVVGKRKISVDFDNDMVLFPEAVFRSELKWRLLNAFGESFAAEAAEAQILRDRVKAQVSGGAKDLMFGCDQLSIEPIGYVASNTVIIG
jgi:hypothetical protein